MLLKEFCDTVYINYLAWVLAHGKQSIIMGIYINGSHYCVLKQ